MKTNRNVYTAAAGVIAACMAVATASAQNFMIYQYGAAAGAVSQTSVANLKPNWVVTGVRNGQGKMELITWKSNGHALLRKGSAVGQPLDNASVATVALSPTLVVTGGVYLGALQLTTWSISSTGAVTFGTYLLSSDATSVRMTKVDSGRLLVATESDGQLQVTLFAISPTEIIFQGVQYGVAGTIPSITSVSKTWFVTAMRTSAGDLQLDSWTVSAGNALSHQETASAGAVSALDITGWDSGHVATPVRNGGGDLELIDWSLNTSTGDITRNSSQNGGAISQVTASTMGTEIFTASINSTGNVDAGVWGYNGSQITAGDSAAEEAANEVAAAPLSTGLYSVTATRTASGTLQVDVWTGDYTP
jgi:hypothetical protein